MQSTPLTLATCRHVTQAATLCPRVDNFLHNTSWIYGNSPPEDMFLPQLLSFRGKRITATCPVCSRV